jgi:hypothetical protein
VLYPPVMLWVFAPLALLPGQAWYVIPAAMVAWSLWRLRPAWWAWPLMLLIAAMPWTIGYFVLGNPKVWGFAALFVLLALGWRWWIVAGIAAVLLSLPFGSLWGDYRVVMTNARSMEYQWSTVLLVAIPVIAWLGSVAGRAHDPQREHVLRRRSAPEPQRPEAVRVAHGDGVEVVGR